MTRAAATLEQIRSGIDAQAAAVASLVEQSAAGIGRTGADAAESLATNVSSANVAIDGLTSRIAEQERASQRIVAETSRALAELDQHFTGLAETRRSARECLCPVDPQRSHRTAAIVRRNRRAGQCRRSARRACCRPPKLRRPPDQRRQRPIVGRDRGRRGRRAAADPVHRSDPARARLDARSSDRGQRPHPLIGGGHRRAAGPVRGLARDARRRCRHCE